MALTISFFNEVVRRAGTFRAKGSRDAVFYIAGKVVGKEDDFSAIQKEIQDYDFPTSRARSEVEEQLFGAYCQAQYLAYED